MKSAPTRIAILALAHLVVDFYGGLLIPLPEPTLMRHLATSLVKAMTVITFGALVVNAIQPLAGLILPARGLPALLAAAPVIAAAVAMIGLTRNYWVIVSLCVTSAAAIGLMHPEAALTVQSLSDKRQGLAMAAFMSGGFLGFSLGAFAGGWWAQALGLRLFWLLTLPGVVVSGLVLLSSLHRFHERREAVQTEPSRSRVRLSMALLLAVAITSTMCLLVRLYPVFMVRSFGEGAQAWSGATIFSLGIAGAFGSYAWGWASGKLGCGLPIAMAQALGAPFLFLLLHPTSPAVAPVWATGLGLTIGSVYPLTVVLCRKAHGGSQRLRLGLGIGGAWGAGELIALAATRYVEQAGEPVARALNLAWVLLAIVAATAALISRIERPGKALTRAGV